MPVLAFNLNSSNPLSAPNPDARNSGFICLVKALVSTVFRLGSKSQVFRSIVRRIMVYVVNLIGGPLTVKQCPHHPVRINATAIQGTKLVTTGVNKRQRLRPRQPRIPTVLQPLTRELVQISFFPVQKPR